MQVKLGWRHHAHALGNFHEGESVIKTLKTGLCRSGESLSEPISSERAYQRNKFGI